MTTLRIGTRASRLALVQTEKVAANLQNEAGVSVEVVHYQTSGDRIQDRPLQPHLGSSFFTKEIEVALLIPLTVTGVFELVPWGEPLPRLL